MWSVRVRFKSGFEIYRLPKSVRREATQAMLELRENPIPADAVRLEGYNNLYRVRFAKVYRLVYAVSQTHRTIVVLRAAHRSVVYDGMARNPELVIVHRPVRLHSVP